jgi:ANTAR domain
MEATGFVVLSTSTATYLRVSGSLPGLDAGLTIPRGRSLVARVLDGAPAASSDVPAQPNLLDTVEHEQLGVHSYVVTPILDPGGNLLGLLVGLDRAAVTAPPAVVSLLRGIGDALGASGQVPARDGEDVGARPNGPAPPTAAGRPPTPETVARAVRTGRPGPPRPTPPGRPGPPPGPAGTAGGPAGAAGGGQAGRAESDVRLRRATSGWIVEGPGAEIRPVGDLISAMVLADLLDGDLAPPARPRRADRDLSELDKLKLSVVQLEHALASRVIVEQAIGVLAERNRIRPRDAFERLRRTARGMGRRVHDLARQVVDSVGDPRATLPGELGGRGGAPRPTPPRTTPSRS